MTGLTTPGKRVTQKHSAADFSPPRQAPFEIMKHSLQLRLSQHLTLTPQLQQSIRLLQLSTLELNQEIEKFLQDNPLLERDDGIRETPVGAPPPGSGVTEYNSGATPGGDSDPAESDGRPGDADSGSSSGFDEDFGSSPGSTRDGNDEAGYSQLAAEVPTLRDHLISQLSLTNLPDREQRLVMLLIDSLDDDGYLHQDLD